MNNVEYCFTCLITWGDFYTDFNACETVAQKRRVVKKYVHKLLNIYPSYNQEKEMKDLKNDIKTLVNDFTKYYEAQ